MLQEDVLMKAVLNQIGMDTLDYKKLAEAIGAPNGQAARKRWGRYYEKLTSGAAPKSAAGGRVAKPAAEKKKKAPSKKAQPANKSKKPVEETDNATPSDEEVFATPSKKLQGIEDRGSDLKEELTEAEDDGADNANDSNDDQEQAGGRDVEDVIITRQGLLGL